MNGLAMVAAGCKNGSLNTAQVADVLNVSIRTVRNYARRKDGALRCTEHRLGMRRVMQFERADVASFADRHDLPLDWSRLEQEAIA